MYTSPRDKTLMLFFLFFLQERFTHIDYGYNYNLAKVAKEKNVRLLSLMSTQGANKDSYFLYLNSKGKVRKIVIFSILIPKER